MKESKMLQYGVINRTKVFILSKRKIVYLCFISMLYSSRG